MSTPAFTEQEIKDYVKKWSIEYFEVAKADQPYIRVDYISKIGVEDSNAFDEWEIRVWYTEEKYAIVYVKVNNQNELEVIQIDY